MAAKKQAKKSLPSVDLSSAFGPADIQGPPARQKPPPGPQAREEAPGRSEPPLGAPDAPSPVGRRRGRPRQAPVDPQAPQTLVLWMPVELREQMQAEKSASGRSYQDQVLDAIEDQVDQLDDLVAAATRPPVTSGRVFERRGATPAGEGAGHRVQITIRAMLASQMRAIDDLVDQTGAPSRSALINAALAAHLAAR